MMVSLSGSFTLPRPIQCASLNPMMLMPLLLISLLACVCSVTFLFQMFMLFWSSCVLISLLTKERGSHSGLALYLFVVFVKGYFFLSERVISTQPKLQKEGPFFSVEVSFPQAIAVSELLSTICHQIADEWGKIFSCPNSCTQNPRSAIFSYGIQLIADSS